MRRIRIAAFALAAALACLAISHLFSIEPAADATAEPTPQAGDSGSVATPPVVPAPPPLPGEKTAQPSKKRSTPSKLAHDELVPSPPPVSPAGQTRIHPQVQAQVQISVEPKPTIWRGGSETHEDAALSPVPTVTEIVSVEEPKGPVIVVPHERPKEANRGVRWLKAVGRVLGIGGKLSPEEEAFR